MPSEATLNKKYLSLLPSPGVAYSSTTTTNIPIPSAINTAGTGSGIVLGGHAARLQTIGKTFTALPTGGNTYLPSCPGVNRLDLVERFLQRPALNAVLDTTGASSSAALIAYTIANKDWEVLGSNMTTALCTFSSVAGIRLTTAGGANTTDAGIVLPHLDTTQTGWQAYKWNTDYTPVFETVVKPIGQSSLIGSTKIWAGLKTTNTDVAATDDDQAYFVLDTGTTPGTDTLGVSATKWVCVNSTNASGSVVDNATSSGITVLPDTYYHLMIVVDQHRVPYFFINGFLVAVGNGSATAGVTTTNGRMKTNINLVPYVGVIQRTSGTAAAVEILGISCSKALTALGSAA